MSVCTDAQRRVSHMRVNGIWRKGPLDDQQLADLAAMAPWRRRLVSHRADVHQQVYLWELRQEVGRDPHLELQELAGSPAVAVPAADTDPVVVSPIPPLGFLPGV
jgi:hypothetical protein